jgi:hypothetical protein
VVYSNDAASQIHVYRPISPFQALPALADMIIDPPPSDQVSRHATVNHIDLEDFLKDKHQINHLIVGELGNQEIVLCACEDGDVIAYYTHLIEQFLNDPDSKRMPRPFFHENVGASAWGLAIHQHERMIAVSSNRHEVQVFAFALQRDPYPKGEGSVIKRTKGPALVQGEDQGFRENFLPMGHSDQDPRLLPMASFKNRTMPMVFQITLPPHVGDNIPSIAFSGRNPERAETIVASDIRGGLWFLSIWENSFKYLPMAEPRHEPAGDPLGWGVLVIPPWHVKPTNNDLETWGCPRGIAHQVDRIDITETLYTIRDHRTSKGKVMHTLVRYLPEIPPTSTHTIPENLLHSNLLPSLTLITQDQRGALKFVRFGHPKFEKWHWIIPGRIEDIPPDHVPLKYKKTLSGRLNDAAMSKSHNREFAEFVPEGHMVFYAGRHSIVLLQRTDAGLPTMCDNILDQSIRFTNHWQGVSSNHFNRLNMLEFIPELSLMLVGSQIGRVALVTITRPTGKSPVVDQASMRVDLVLPFDVSDWPDWKWRPNTGLLGIAVSRMPGRDGEVMGRRGGEVPRWRLILHYDDHTILTYAISREEELTAESL